MKKVLAFCDSPPLHSGFARVARALFSRWPIDPKQLDVWAVGFHGWGYEQTPHQLYPADAGPGKPWHHPERLQRFLDLLNTGRYSHVWILQDAFGFPPAFCTALRQVADAQSIRIMAYCPVDAPWEPEWTSLFGAADVAATYTEYGADEIRRAWPPRQAPAIHVLGNGKAWQEPARPDAISDAPAIHILPHGMDPCFTPGSRTTRDTDRAALREAFWKQEFVQWDDFLLVMVAMHQRRKDVSRALEILAGLRERGVPAKLVLHMGRYSDGNAERGVDLESVGRQLGLQHGREYVHHAGLMTAGLGGLTDAQLADLYRAADCFLTTSLGEGWGLPITEALACGCPVAVPDHTACREIVCTLAAHGMAADRGWLLPVGDFAPAMENDNSRLRSRVDVGGAVIAIQDLYESGVWRERPPVTPAGRDWLDWGRIAAEHWRLLMGKG